MGANGDTIGYGILAGIFGGVTYLFKSRGSTAESRYQMFKEAPLVDIDSLDKIVPAANSGDNAPFVKIMGKVGSQEQRFCEYAKNEEGKPIEAVVTQLTTRSKTYHVKISTLGMLSFYDSWGGVHEEPIKLPPLFIAPHRMDAASIMNGWLGGSPTYKAVTIDMGKGSFKDPLVFPYLKEKSVLQVAHQYRPRSVDETSLRNQCQMETMAMFTAAVVSKKLEGKDASVANSVLLGHDVKEYAIKQAAPVWAAGHVRRDVATGGYCLFEDDLEETPFVLSTQPLDAIEATMASEVRWNQQMVNVFGGITGLFLLGAVRSVLPKGERDYRDDK
jgi:hypothetical protein